MTKVKVPVIWRGDRPHLYAKHYEDLKLAHRGHTVKASKIRPELLSRAAAVMEAVANHSRDHLKQFIMKKVTEVQLEAHRRSGHRTFMRECPDCRQGGIRQRQHRRLPPQARPGQRWPEWSACAGPMAVRPCRGMGQAGSLLCHRSVQNVHRRSHGVNQRNHNRVHTHSVLARQTPPGLFCSRSAATRS